MKEFQIYHKRKPLIDMLPLEAPLGVHVCPSTYCNFKCHYCKHSVDTFDGGVGKTGWLKREFMGMDMYKLLIRQLSKFPKKIKTLNFAWLGEPLLHPQIVEMVKIAKEANVAETVSIVTNGSLLSHEMSDGLIEAGLDLLRISLQGLTAEDYWTISKYKIDFEKYVENIAYFYEYKKDTRVYIKIMDAMLKSDDDERKFRDLFEPICDVINIEHLVPLQNELDISDMKNVFEVNYFGDKVKDNKICAYSFFLLVISPKGDIMPCPEAGSYIDGNGKIVDMHIGNIKDISIYDYWNGKMLNSFRLNMIKGKKDSNRICEKCSFIKYHTAEEDRLDDFKERLLKYYQ